MMDYVFTPMNFVLRGYKKIGLIISITVTFLLVGLWHGANWTFLLFGSLHGLYFIPLIIQGSMNKSQMGYKWKICPGFVEIFNMVAIFLLVSVTSVILRAENIGQAFNYIAGILSPSLFTVPKLVGEQNSISILMLVLTISLIGADFIYRKKENVFNGIHRKSFIFQLIVFVFISIIIFVLGGSQQSFIYFQF
jgi:D-alanyl-lipoteichoic acid acyltransferase DltB (MBOAT superfamily)